MFALTSLELSANQDCKGMRTIQMSKDRLRRCRVAAQEDAGALDFNRFGLFSPVPALPVDGLVASGPGKGIRRSGGD